MKNIVFFIVSIGFFVACNSSRESVKHDTPANALLPSTVSLSYLHTVDVPEEYSFFLKGIDYEKFAGEVFQKVKSGSIQPLYPFTAEPMPTDDIENKVLATKAHDCKEILFEEQWFLDAATFEMYKTISSYTLVKEQERFAANNSSELMKIPVCKIVQTELPDKSKLKLLEKNVAYEVPLYNKDNPEFLENIMPKHVLNVFLEKALSESVPVYSFMLRDSLIALTIDDVKFRLGEGVELVAEYDSETGEEDTLRYEKKIDPQELSGLAFIEDWYIDETSMAIYKDVKAVALVREYYKFLDQNDPELVKVIPFMMFFSSHTHFQ